MLRYFGHVSLMALSVCLAVSEGATVYDESLNGDFSNSGLAPTGVTVAIGSNQIFGTTGRGTAVDRDYFLIVIPNGAALTALIELPGTTIGGEVSFIGVQTGNQVTVPVNAADATGLLGWTHYGMSPNMDLLSVMAIPSMGSRGFNVPLGAGTYSFWVQDFNAGTFTYGFDLRVAQVPEPGTYTLVLAGCAGLALLGRRLMFR